MSASFVVRSRKVATPEGLRPAAVHVREGRIDSVSPHDHVHGAGSLLDFGEKALLPGLVDSHVHINDPGRSEWEGFSTATTAAAAGGVTTLVDMPLNSIPVTTTAAALEAKLAAASGRLAVDCAFWGGVVPGNLSELLPLADAGVRGFKAFLIDSGIPEFPAVGEEELRPAMTRLAARGLPLIAHAELAGPCARAGDPKDYSTYLASRPKGWENEAVDLLIRLCRETGCRTHIVHLSSAEALGPLREARREGLPVSAETCPHYLSFASEEVPRGDTRFKCSPPIREKANQDLLWEALGAGTIECVVSDHSPCAPELKKTDGDFMKAWGGISSVQLLLPAVWTEARRRGFGLDQAASWLGRGPAALAGLSGRKGALVAGADADLVVFDADASFEVDPGRLRHRHKTTPYAGLRLYGAVEKTFLRGELIHDRDDPALAPNSGRTLLDERLPIAG